MSTWNFHGTYYESCNCEAICPCRVQGDRPGGDTTYGTCDFVVSWFIEDGRIGDLDVTDRAVVITKAAELYDRKGNRVSAAQARLATVVDKRHDRGRRKTAFHPADGTPSVATSATAAEED